VAEGLRIEPGDEILVVQDDFPANQIPWFRQERRQARVVTVPRKAGKVLTEDILARISPKTRLVALPFVLWDTGQRLDIETIGAALKDHRAFFCVDAIQGLGAFPLDVERAHIDFLAADSHKWMMGLEGIGLFYCRQERLEELDDPFQSWLSVEDPFTPWHSGKQRLADARRFEFASLPTVAIFGIEACLSLLLKTGVDRMATRILEITDRLADGLAEQGWNVRSPRTQEMEKSGIVSALPPKGTAEDAVAELEKRHVSVAMRGGGVRFSPHAWNTLDEVERLLDLLA
jgi:selenocysteine lyase/cysteine desulfurase